MANLASSFLIGSSLVVQVTRPIIKAWIGLKFGRIRPWTVELVSLVRIKDSPYTYNGRNVVSTLVLSILKRSYTFLQIRRTAIKAWMILNVSKIPSHIMELDTLEHLKNCWLML